MIRFIKSEGGSILIPVVASVAIIGVVAAISTSTIKGTLDRYSQKQLSSARIDAYQSMQTLLSDQRICNAVFPSNVVFAGGWNNPPASKVFDFKANPFSGSAETSAAKTYLKGKLDSAQSATSTDLSQNKDKLNSVFRDHQLTSIKIYDPKFLGATGTMGEQMRQYRVALTIDVKGSSGLTGTGFLKSSAGLVGTRTFGDFSAGGPIRPEEELYVVFGQNSNECYLHHNLGDDSAPTDYRYNSVALSCKAIGGKFEAGKCRIKELQTDMTDPTIPDVPINASSGTPAYYTDKTTLRDGLCRLELEALRRIGPHFIKQSSNAANGAKAGYTSLCQVPKWAGCTEGARYNPGDDYQNTPALNNPAPTNSFKAKDLKKKEDNPIQNYTDATYKKRFARAVNMMAQNYYRKNVGNYAGGSSNDSAFNSAASNYMGGAVGYGIYQGSFTAGAYALAMNAAFVTVFGPFGLVMSGIVMSAIMPQCDKARLKLYKRCNDGMMEVDRVVIQTQKIKWKITGPKCRWRDSGHYDTETERQIALGTNPSDQTIKMDQASMHMDPAVAQSDADVTKECTDVINAANTIPQFYASDSDPEDVDPAAPLDPSTSDPCTTAYNNKEVSLWSNYKTSNKSSLDAIVSRTPAPQGATELPTDYAARKATFKNQKNSDIAALESTYNSNKSLASGTKQTSVKTMITQIGTDFANAKSAVASQ